MCVFLSEKMYFMYMCVLSSLFTVSAHLFCACLFVCVPVYACAHGCVCVCAYMCVLVHTRPGAASLYRLLYGGSN